MISYIIRKELLYTVATAVIVLYILVKYFLKKRGNDKVQPPILNIYKIMFYLYIVALIGVTLFPIRIPPLADPLVTNFVNWDIKQIFNYDSAWGFVRNNVGNILLFIPLIPLFGVALSKKELSFSKALVISFSSSMIIEILQYGENAFGLGSYPPRISDINDLIMNTIGGVIGYGAYKILKRYGRIRN